jgi:P-type Ca2+ transporter type 2C
LAIAIKKLSKSVNKLDIKSVNELEFLGVVTILDPIRPEVKLAIEKTRNAGIKVIMLTGDHKDTATSIGLEIGLIKDSEINQVFSEDQLIDLNDKEFRELVKTGVIFTRLSPTTKFKILKTLQDSGQLVAMTGDGVNDAPALKQANVGVSMGKIGTDVAREASDVILINDNFASIISAVEEGRLVFENVRKASYFLLSTNLAEIVTILTSGFLGIVSPISAIQILWLNLVTDGINGIAIGTEKNANLMDKKPLNHKENILNKKVLPYLLIMALVMMPLTLITYFWLLPQGTIKASSGAFFVMSMTQIFNLLNLKSLNESSLKVNLFNNKWLNFSAFVSGFLIIFVPFTPIAEFLKLVPLSFVETIILILLSSLVFWVMEGYELLKGKKS